MKIDVSDEKYHKKTVVRGNPRLFRSVFALICCSICSMTFFFLYAILGGPPNQDIVPMKLVVTGSRNAIRTFIRKSDMDTEWIPILKRGKIIEHLDIGHHGLADKYVKILEGGYVAMVKPCRHVFLFWPWFSFSTWDWERDAKGVIKYAVRMDRVYQGWGEIIGFYLDRLLRFYKKPPIVGRYISNKTLYKEDYSVRGNFLRMLPTHSIAVAMHAWTDGMRSAIPHMEYGDFLRGVKKSMGIRDIDAALGFSDVILFDYLLDDHDRMGVHNWKESADGIILVWDSGLALNYGPVHTTIQLLCGPHNWNPQDVESEDLHVENCEPICVFRKETIDMIRYYKLQNTTLGSQLCEKLKEDDVTHLFEHGLYEVFRSWWFPTVIRFSSSSFCKGIDARIDVLEEHIARCTDKLGADRVLFRSIDTNANARMKQGLAISTINRNRLYQ